MIPLFDESGSKLTSLKGEVSYFYEFKPKDLEAVDRESAWQEIERFEDMLTQTKGVVKVYSLGGRAYLNLFNQDDLGGVERAEVDFPLSKLCNCDKIHFYENYLTAGYEFIRVMSVKEFPDSLSLFETNSFPDYVIHLKRVEKIKAKERINLRRKLHFSSLYKAMRDIESEEAYKQSEELLGDITTDRRSLFEAEMFFIVRGRTKEELDQKSDAFKLDFEGKNGELIVEERGLSFFFKGLIPGVMPSFKRRLDPPSDYLSLLIPHHQDFLYSKGISFNARSGKEIKIDLFGDGSPNFNALITGGTGQGKSVLANKILKEEIARGTKALVIDLGNSFLKNTMFHEGSVKSLKFNPLHFKDPSYLKALVLSVVDEEFSKKQEGELFELITTLVSDNSNLSWSEFVEGLERRFSGIRFYFSEIEKYFTDDLEVLSDLTYCDFSSYPDSMKAPMIIYLLESFKNLHGRKIFLFDECWSLLEKNADYVAECFRTFRKYGASAVAISQNLDDFKESALGRVIIQNSFHKFLFRQPLSESEFVGTRARDISEQIFSVKGEYSEFLYINEQATKPVRYYPTALEYELFTSDKLDRDRFDHYMEELGRFLNFKEAMLNFVKIRYPTEVSYA